MSFLKNLTLKEKIIIGGFVVVLLIIPPGTYLIAQRTKAATGEIQTYDKVVTTKTATQSAKEVPKTNGKAADARIAEEVSEIDKTLNQLVENSAQLSLGPTLDFSAKLEGRPVDNQAGKIFLGLAEGLPILNPKYVLSFLIDLPADGNFKGLSLSGLNQGAQYTAYLKGRAQIATAAAFTVKPAFTQLPAVYMLSGDLNEDNIVNVADYSIVKTALGTTPSSPNWNENVDINRDGVVNIFDLSFVVKNLNKVGASGVWQSSPVSSGSAELKTQPTSLGSIGVDLESVSIKPPPAGGPTPIPVATSRPEQVSEPVVVPGEGGSWIWLPKY